jgi:hypothetical protein
MARYLSRVYYNLKDFWMFVKQLVDGLPAKADLLAGLESFCIAGIRFDRYGVATPAASTDDDVANLADLEAFGGADEDN